MSELSAAKIQKNPKYHQLIKERDALAWTLSALVLIIYFGFILLVAFAPGFLTQPISATSVIPVGMLIGRWRDRRVGRADGHLRLPRQHRLRPAHSTKSSRSPPNENDQDGSDRTGGFLSTARCATGFRSGCCSAWRGSRGGSRQLARGRDVHHLRFHHADDHLLGGEADQDGDRLLCGGTGHHRLPERDGHCRRLHVGRVVSRHRRTGLLQWLLRPHLLGGLAGRLADHPVPDRGAAAQPGQVHLCRRCLVPAATGSGPYDGGDRLAHRGDLVPDRAGGGGRAVAAHAGAADLLPGVHRHHRRADHHLRDLRRHEGHDLGSDHQGRPAARWCHADGARRDGAFGLEFQQAILRCRRTPPQRH